MKLGNWHIIHDSELKKIREIETSLKRRFTAAQIEELRNGKIHLQRYPVKRVAA